MTCLLVYLKCGNKVFPVQALMIPRLFIWRQCGTVERVFYCYNLQALIQFLVFIQTARVAFSDKTFIRSFVKHVQTNLQLAAPLYVAPRVGVIHRYTMVVLSRLQFKDLCLINAILNKQYSQINLTYQG